MVPTTTLLSKASCDCCNALIEPGSNEDCPRCGYPVSPSKEERFLVESIQSLQRVATYGGAYMSVANLLSRYRVRLNFLRQQRYNVHVQQSQPVVASPALPSQKQVAREAPIVAAPQSPFPEQVAAQPAPATTAQQVMTAPPLPPTAPRPMFSLRSFLAEQTITIVSSLGAFLILLGSLSFVATTRNLALSFLVVLIVHSIFAGVGFTIQRFQSFRSIARIYTTIFALLVPLVGFSGYRLVAGQFIPIPAPTVVVMAASYAAIVYAILAVSQRFKPFGYLAAVALVVADLALSFSFHLNFWWWPVLLMPLAFGSLVSVRNGSRRPFSGAASVLREPVRVLMYACIVTLCGSILYSYISTSISDGLGTLSLPSEARFAGIVMLVLSLLWTCSYIWTTKRSRWLLIVPYQVVGCVAGLAYAFALRNSGYGLALVGVAVSYHVFALYMQRQLHHVKWLYTHIEGIVLCLITAVPFIVSPFLYEQLINVSHSGYTAQVLLKLQYGTDSAYLTEFFVNRESVYSLLSMLVGCVVSLSVVVSHTGFCRIPAQKSWCWLLLLSGFLCTCVYSMLILWTKVVPTFAFLALTLVLLTTTIVVRHRAGTSWSNPLDVLVLCMATLTLLMNNGSDRDTTLALLLLFAGLSYIVPLHQKRPAFLFLPLLLVSLAFPVLLERPRVLLLLAVVLPFVAVMVRVFIVKRQARQIVDRAVTIKTRVVSRATWELPLVLIGLFCGTVVCLQDSFSTTNTLQNWFGVPCTVFAELAALACVWYIAAALARVKGWLFSAVGFACAALLVPLNSFSLLLCVAFTAALLALGINQFAARAWAFPLYGVAVVAALMMGLIGHNVVYAAFSPTVWALLAFASLLYGIGVIEDFPYFLWLAPCFAVWSVYDAASLGDLYRPPVVALVCALVGVGIGVGANILVRRRGVWFRFALPFYTTAIAAAILTGFYGTLAGINHPFATAIPDALVLYAVVAYAVLVFERQSRWLWMVAAFSLWGTVLAVQTNAVYIIGLGFGAGILGLVLSQVLPLQMQPTASVSSWSRWIKWSWGWPWYMTALVAALLLGAWYFLPIVEPVSGLMETALFGFGVLAYLVGVVEDVLPWSWIGVVLFSWSLLSATWWKGEFPLLFAVTLVSSGLGLGIRIAYRRTPMLFTRIRRPAYALPFYAVALTSAVFTFVYAISTLRVNLPFYAAVPMSFFVYAVIAYIVLLFERRPNLLWLVFTATTVGLLCLLPTALCVLFTSSITSTMQVCGKQVQTTAVLIASLALVTGILGIVTGRVIKVKRVLLTSSSAVFLWSWPWYSTALLGMLLSITWNHVVGRMLLPGFIEFGSIGVFVLLTLFVMLMERRAEVVVVPVALVIWAISLLEIALWQQMLLYCALCYGVFASHYVWYILPASSQKQIASKFYAVLALGGQTYIILLIIMRGGLFSSAGALAHVGAFALFLLALLILWCGRESSALARVSIYTAGLLFAFVVTWELSALGQTHLDWLTLAPATYLVVIAPILSRDERMQWHQSIGQLCSIMGSALLLLPTLWSSFSETSLLPSLILAGEALALLLLGAGTRMRVFVLSGAGLVIVSTMHALFLPSLGIPTSLALAVTGVTLLTLATALSLARHRLQVVWAHLD